MRTGQAVHIWGPRGVTDVLREIRMTGDEGAELFATQLNGPLATPESLGDEFQRAGLRLAGIYVDVSPRSLHEVKHAVQMALDVIPFLLAAEGDRLIVGPGPRDPGGPSAAQLALLGDALSMVGREARAAGVLVCFHQHMGGLVETPAEFETIMHITDPACVFLCLDTGHLAKAGIDPVATSAKYGRRVMQVHLKDIREDSFVQLGEGSLDNQQILERLWRGGYRGWVIPEIPTTNPRQAAEANHRYLRSILDSFIPQDLQH